jgi:hypothetical protein
MNFELTSARTADRLIEHGPTTKPSPQRVASNGWYILYHDAGGHNVRRARDVESAILAAAFLLPGGRIVVQIGPMNYEGREAVMGPSEIRQRCAALPAADANARLRHRNGMVR